MTYTDRDDRYESGERDTINQSPSQMALDAQRVIERMATFDNISAWQLETFGLPTPQDIAVRMLGECVELCQKTGALPYAIQSAVDHELRRANTRLGQPYDRDGVLDELADLMIFVIANATANHFSEEDIENAIEAKHHVNLDREWDIIKTGIAQHREAVSGDDPGDSNDG